MTQEEVFKVLKEQSKIIDFEEEVEANFFVLEDHLMAKGQPLFKFEDIAKIRAFEENEEGGNPGGLQLFAYNGEKITILISYGSIDTIMKFVAPSFHYKDCQTLYSIS